MGVLFLVGISLRLSFWYATDLTLEDALITFRYADNLADGRGFVYNEQEKVLGTTSPLWALLLASMKIVGLPDVIPVSKVLGVVFDSATLLMLFILIRSAANGCASFVTATFFATSPNVIPMSIAGMETSLLLCCMTVAMLGYEKKNLLFPLGLALTIMTRIDGVLFAVCFVGASFVSDRRWALRSSIFSAVLLLPWFAFSLLYFGNALPQSLLAKMSVYRFDFAASSMPFIGTFTPFSEVDPVKLVLKALLLVGMTAGSAVIMKKYAKLTPAVIFFLIYCLVFMSSRSMIFLWYLVPAIFVSYVLLGVGFDWGASLIRRKLVLPMLGRQAIMIVVGGISLFLLAGRVEKYKELQAFEDELRKEIGLWLNKNVAMGSTVLMEPIGYIGYYAGPGLKIRDEIGIITPEIVELRNSGEGWYTKALKALRPDYVVQYQSSIDQNRSEGTNEKLFADDDDSSWFSNRYKPMKIFRASCSYPFIEEKEKAYVIFRQNGVVQ